MRACVSRHRRRGFIVRASDRERPGLSPAGGGHSPRRYPSRGPTIGPRSRMSIETEAAVAATPP